MDVQPINPTIRFADMVEHWPEVEVLDRARTLYERLEQSTSE